MSTTKYPNQFHITSFPRKGVLHVQLNRPEKLNAMHKGAYTEYGEIFKLANDDTEVLAIVVSGNGRAFNAGLDVSDGNSDFAHNYVMEKSRGSLRIHRMIRDFQDSIGQAYTINKPVIGVVHGPAFGLAIDILTAHDIRFAAENTIFSVKEVDLGMCADIGTLQRLPKIVGNLGWIYDVTYSGRRFGVKEAKEQGFVQYVYPTLEETLKNALDYAENIATKSPVAVHAIKKCVKFAVDHPVPESLEQQATVNAFALGDDFVEGALAALSRTKIEFAKL